VRLPRTAYLWLCDRLYHELAFAYDWVAAMLSGGRWRTWCRTAGQRIQARNVVEVGPGTGHLLPAVAVEFSATMARRAASRAPGAVARGDARALPLLANSVDVLIATFPAQYVLEPAFWREAARVVRPGGRLRLLLYAGAAYPARGAGALLAPAAEWRSRRANRRVGDATLAFLLARRR
jgi:ubiquinone/menaquinone biosynthesis C-methylase UbiE